MTVIHDIVAPDDSHFTDNDLLPSRGEEGYSRLQKVDPVINHLKDKFKSVYYPH